MKYFFALCATLLSFSGFAQPDRTYKNEFHISYGRLPLEDIGQALGEHNEYIMAVPAPEQGQIFRKGFNYYGMLNLTYRYHVSPRCWLGISSGVGMNRAVYLYQNPAKDTPEPSGFTQNLYIPLAGELAYAYYQGSAFRAYMLLGLGKTLGFYKNQYGVASLQDKQGMYTDAISFQITPIGMRFGKKQAGFVEVGVGYRGVINAGYTVSF